MKYVTLIIVLIVLSGCGSLLPKHYTIQDCESLEAHNIAQCKIDTLSEFLNGSNNVVFRTEDCGNMGIEDQATLLACERKVQDINAYRASMQQMQGMQRLQNFQRVQTMYNLNNLMMRY